MKKISCISVDADSLEWLANAVQASHVCKGSAELSRALRELAQGRADTLMLECGQPSPADDGMTFGELTIYQKSRRVVCAGQEVQLTPKEFDILFFLSQNPGVVFTKEQLYQAVWMEPYYTADSNIMAFIRKLRKKIEPNPDAPQYILTVWGIGYQFNDRL